MADQPKKWIFQKIACEFNTVSNKVVVTNGILWLESTPGFC